MTSSSLPESTTTKPRRLGWTGLIGLTISALLLWWVLHDVDLRDVLERFRRVRVLPFLLMVGLATLTFPLRAVRWRYLLRDQSRVLPFRPLWHATAVGFMANNLLPARAGEFARAYVAQRLTPVRFSSAFASIAVERVMDGIVLVAFMVVAIWAGGFSDDTMVGGVTLGFVAQGMGTVFGVVLVGALLVVHWPEPAIRLTRAVTSRVLPHRGADWVVGTLEGLLTGLDSLKSFRRFAQVSFWSLIVWLVNGASFYVGFIAFGIQTPRSAALMLQSLIGFGVAIPSAPGFFGPFEFASRVGLALYDIDASQAVTFAIGYHLSTFLPITLLGIWSLTRAHLGLREVTGGTAVREERNKGGDDQTSAPAARSHPSSPST